MSDQWFADDPLAGYGAWRPLASSNLDAYKFDPESRELLIQFHGGRVYKYFNISQEMADGLGSASSPGGWFWQNLRGAPFEKQ